MGDSDATNVRVAVRFRPLNSREKAINDTDCIIVDGNQVTLNAQVAGNENKNFAFDFVFQENCLQSEVWDSIGDPILAKAFSGYNGTIFAYGQTGSGKTWSMQGGSTEELRGIIPRMTATVFALIDREKEKHPSMQFLVTASYFELYNEVIFDLLDSSDRRKRPKGGLEIKEHPVLGVYVKNLQEVVIDSAAKMQSMIDQGMGNRTTASTQMNAESSRSHSVFTFKLHQKDLVDETKNLFAKVNLVDLAGSERQKSTGAVGATLKEGANINKSLSALGNVINALVEASKGKKGVFIPYRNSKLTRVLQESLGGNSITIMVAAMSRGLSSADETLSTLKYADRAKAIKVKAIKNDESSQISRLNDEIRALKEKLMRQEVDGGGGSAKFEVADVSEIEERHRQQLKDLEEAMKSTWEEKARISEGHETERLRLEAEQQEAARQLSRQVQEKWQVIEDKKDIDLSISHVKECSKSYLPEAVSMVGNWQKRLRDFLKQEAELLEQDTVVAVYRSSLTKDEQNLMRGSGSSESPVRRTESGIPLGDSSSVWISADKSTISLWKQMKERFKVLETEAKKWINMQDALLVAISALKEGVSADMESLNQMQPQTDVDRVTDQFAEISRGFDIISRQLIEKEMELHSSISKSKSSNLEFHGTADRMFNTLQDYAQSLHSELKDEGLFGDNEKATILKEIQSVVGIISTHFNLAKASVVNTNGANLLPVEVRVSTTSEKEFQRTLPNGLEVEACIGELGDTVSALAHVLDWGILLKKNAPEKLLKRPPVRFIFDVLKTLNESCNLKIGGNDKFNDCPTWDEVSSSRDSKLNFIRQAITNICYQVNRPIPVEADSVIAGENSEKVNIFLQYAAFAAFNSRSCIGSLTGNEGRAVITTASTAASIGDKTSDQSALMEALSAGASVILRTLEYLVILKDQLRKKKEESMKKIMDGLADEKRQLEERLVKEKDMMKSESLGLSEQLTACQRKLSETEGLLSAEATMRLQLQELVQRTEQEKRDLQAQLQSQFEENDALRTQQLALQTKSQRENVVLESLRKKVDEQEIQIINLLAEIDTVKSTHLSIELEKEEIANQITVLTEERDAARNNEEELFTTLRERNDDLEKLQESYVDMTDRCNDYQDELSDLRDKVDALNDLLQSAREMAPQSVILATSRSEAIISPRMNGHAESTAFSSRQSYTSDKSSMQKDPTVEILVSVDDSGVRSPSGSAPLKAVARAVSPSTEVAEDNIGDEVNYLNEDDFEPSDDYGDDFND